jgi:hypothetical protein
MKKVVALAVLGVVVLVGSCKPIEKYLEQVCKVRGTVLDSVTQNPISSVEVFIDGYQYSELTNVDGEYEMEMAEGTWTLRYEKAGYEATTESVTLSKTNPRVVLTTRLDRIWSPLPAGILVTDRDNGRIVFVQNMAGTGWTSFGTVGSDVGQFTLPTGIELDDQDRIYVADYGNSRLVRLDNMSGSGWIAFGSQGSGTNQFDHIADVAIHAGKIYISDHYNNRIVRIDDMSGAGWVTYGTYGSGVGQFNRTGLIDFDDSGRIYICDYDNDRVVRIDDMSGTGWVELKSPPGGGVGFSHPDGIDFALDGKIYIVDRFNMRIVRVDDMSGAGWTTLGGFNYCRGVELGQDGKIYVGNQYSSQIVRVDDMTGANWTTYGTQGSGINQFGWVNDLLLVY